MKKVINFLLALLVFYIGGKYFPQNIVIPGTQELIITTLLYCVSGWILVGVCLLLLIPAFFGDAGRGLSVLLIITLVIMSVPFELYIIQRLYTGFRIYGGWAYFLLSVALSIIRLTTETENKK